MKETKTSYRMKEEKIRNLTNLTYKKKLIQGKNLFKKLIKDEKSVFYAADRINKTLLNKARKSFHKKDKIFYKFYLKLKNKNILYENDEGTKTRIPFYTPFVEQRKDIDRSSALYSIKMPFELVHADIADIRFFLYLQLIQNIVLLAVDLFTSKVYVYTIKSRNLLSNKLELLYRDIQQKRQQIVEITTMRLQTDLEFTQSEIEKINKKYNVEMFSSRVPGGKAYAAEQKIREFKKLLFKSKCVLKATSNKRFDLTKITCLAVKNMSNIRSQKYGYALDAIDEKALLESTRFWEIYDFYRLVKVKQRAERYEHANIKKDKVLWRKLRVPLKIGEKVLLALAEQIKKKDAPRNLFKSTTKNIYHSLIVNSCS